MLRTIDGFLQYYQLVYLRRPSPSFVLKKLSDWLITLLQTGLSSRTVIRIKMLKKYLTKAFLILTVVHSLLDVGAVTPSPRRESDAGILKF